MRCVKVFAFIPGMEPPQDIIDASNTDVATFEGLKT
jgi:hypothetical protein